MLTQEMLAIATAASIWDTGNKVLYALCAQHPNHTKDDEIIAKVWLIGRAYAAAIERTKPSKKLKAGNSADDSAVIAGDDFYTSRVAPMIRNSEIDQWTQPLKTFSSITCDNCEVITGVHKKVMDLFSQISGLDKRSLASKYLHFHFPQLFFIFDSRACVGIQKFSKVTGRAKRARNSNADNEYRKLVEKCLSLVECIKSTHNAELSPRQIDNLLLYAAEKT